MQNVLYNTHLIRKILINKIKEKLVMNRHQKAEKIYKKYNDMDGHINDKVKNCTVELQKLGLEERTVLKYLNRLRNESDNYSDGDASQGLAVNLDNVSDVASIIDEGNDMEYADSYSDTGSLDSRFSIQEWQRNNREQQRHEVERALQARREQREQQRHEAEIVTQIRREQREEESYKKEQFNEELASKATVIKNMFMNLVDQYTLKEDIRFFIDLSDYQLKINNEESNQQERYQELKEEIKTWWTPCARSKGNSINEKLKDLASNSIKHLRKSLTKLKDFSDQEPEDCKYEPLHIARKSYKIAWDDYVEAKKLGLEAIESNRLGGDSKKRGKKIIEKSELLLEEIKEKINEALEKYKQKAIKVIYEQQDGYLLNLPKYFEDKISEEMQIDDVNYHFIEEKSSELARIVKENISELRQDDTRLRNQYKEDFKKLLEDVESKEELEHPGIESLMRTNRLPKYIKDTLIESRLETISDQARRDDESSIVSASTLDDEEVPLLGSDVTVEEAHSDFAA